MEQNKKQSDQQQSGRQADQDRNPMQHKSETQRKAEEAARKDKPKGGADSVGNISS